MTRSGSSPARRERLLRRRQREGEQTLRWRYRRLTAPWRRLPDFLVIGAQRSGTTSTYAYLAQHPRIRAAWRKEVHYFDSPWNYKQGEGWYRAHFPMRGSALIAGEATPGYMFRAEAPERMARLVGRARLIALLRDPVRRAVSHYYHDVRGGREPRTIEAAMAAQPSDRAKVRRGTDTYLARGLYAEQLETVLRWFPREQLLIMASEEMFGRTAEAVARLFEFIGLPPARVGVSDRLSAGSYEAMPPAVRARLVEFYRPHNERLYDLLGRDLGWER